jgi:uncharacterized protein involved in exopolysaccharide biosynthesis
VSDEISIPRRIEQPIPTTRELAVVLFRRRRIFLWTVGLVLAAAVLYALTGTKYEAEMQVLVRKGRADAPVSAGVNAPLDLTHLEVTEEEINSEVELLRDNEVMRRVVVQQSGVGGRDWFHFLHMQDGSDQIVERAARRLAKGLKVEPVKKTNLISIRYAAADPQAAARVLRSLASVYLEKHMAVHRPKGELGFFEQQTAESRRQLEQASRRLLDFTQSHGVVSAAQQRDLALQKLSELDAAESQTRIDLAEKRQRARQLIALMTSLPERTTTQVHTADNPELLRSLKAGLLDLQLKRTQLLTKFEPSHRLVQEVEQQILQTQAAIAIESAAPVRDETTDKNVHYEWATAELEQTRVQLQSLSARESATRFQQAASRSLAAKLGEDAILQDDLLSGQKAAEENYLLYVKKREEARMNDALDERGIVNVAIAEQPVAPALPVWSVWMTLAIGFIGAATTGTAAAFVADYLDPAFRDPEDVLA